MMLLASCSVSERSETENKVHSELRSDALRRLQNPESYELIRLDFDDVNDSIVHAVLTFSGESLTGFKETSSVEGYFNFRNGGIRDYSYETIRRIRDKERDEKAEELVNEQLRKAGIGD